jgi:hypothetical protein
MIESPVAVSGLLTFGDLRRNVTLAPGGAGYAAVVERFLPMVQGMAAALMPECAGDVENVSVAVFQTLAKRWRRSRRNKFVGAWLVRWTWFAIAHERSQLRLPVKPGTPEGLRAYNIFKALLRLKPKWFNAVVLNLMLGAGLPKAEKTVGKAANRISKKSKAPSDEVILFLRSLNGSVPATADVAASIVEKSSAAPSPLAEKVSVAWRWYVFVRLVKRMAKVAASAIAVLALLIGTFIYLLTHGHLNNFFISNQQRQLAKEFPGMKQPARALPSAVATTKFPATSAELFNSTSIWPATIHLTHEQWKELQPRHIQPIPLMQAGGRIALRNPNAPRSGLAGALGYDFPWAEGRFEFAGKSFPKTAVRIRGNGTFMQSLYGDKQSLKIDLNHHVKGQDIAGVNTLNLVNSIPDFSYLKDALGEELFRELGAPGPRTAYVYLSMDVPGKFKNQALGLFVMIENIDGDFAKDRFGSKSVPIFKPVTYELFSDLGDDWKAYEAIYDLKTKATPEQLRRVVDLAKLVSHADNEEFARRIPEFLDLEEYAAFVAGHTLLSAYDGYFSNGQNFYVYMDPKTKKFGFIPWDHDHSWGEFGHVATAVKREDASIWHPAAYDNKFLNRVLEVEAFRKLYRKKLEEALAGPFTVERLYAKIDALADRIRPAVAAESDFRLKRFEIATSTNWVAGPRDGKGGMDTKEGPKAPAHQLKRFVQARVKSIRSQLDGEHEGARLSGFN